MHRMVMVMVMMVVYVRVKVVLHPVEAKALNESACSIHSFALQYAGYVAYAAVDNATGACTGCGCRSCEINTVPSSCVHQYQVVIVLGEIYSYATMIFRIARFKISSSRVPS